MSAAAPSHPPIRRRLPANLWLWVGVVGLSFLLRPYRGLFQDGRIYIGRALADLDPGGVGRDLMYAYDAQTDFSLFPRLALGAVRLLGAEAASMLLSGVGLALWTAALVLLARRLAAGRLGWAAAAAMLALAANYGAYDSFSYGEPWATPRAWAEAGVMAGFAAILAGRWRWTVASLAAAVLFHPLMTLPALAVALAVKAQEDRRWAWLFPVGAAGAVLAALLGLPMAERLLQPMDPAWMQALRRSAYLFPDLWPAQAWAQVALELATVLMAARFLNGPARRLYLGVAGMAVLGVAAAGLCALYPSQLLLQVQPWRALWLLVLLANGGLMIALAGLWRAGGLQRLAMWGLVCAWLAFGSVAGAAIGWLVLLLSLAAQGREPALSGLTRRLVMVPAAVLALLYISLRAQSLMVFLGAAKAAGAPVNWPYFLALDLHAPILVALALIWALRERPPERCWAQAAVAIALLIAAAFTWDGRSPWQRDLESGRTRQAFAAAVGPVPGAVYWAEGDIQPWLAMNQAQWASPLQGGPMLFSRDLALQLNGRIDTLVELGLAGPKMRSPFTLWDTPALPTKAPPGAVQALCRRPDAPAAVVLAGRQPNATGPGAPAAYVDLPRPHYVLWDARSFSWIPIRSYTVVRCLSASLSAPRP